MLDEPAEELARRYDAAEHAYLSAVRDTDPDRQLLATLAAAVRDAAKAWEGVAYKEFFSARDDRRITGQPLVEREIEAEKAEVLADLWEDIAAAHAGWYGK